MERRLRFTLVFAPETIAHLNAIERRYHGLIRETINKQLAHNPEQATRNRKPLEQPTRFGATWELRFGPNNRFRVFYMVDPSEQVVWVLAIGIKIRNRLSIAGEEFEL